MDTLIDKYDSAEGTTDSTEKASNDASLLSIEDEEEDQDKYYGKLFMQLSNPEQGDDGMPTGTNVMTKASCR